MLLPHRLPRPIRLGLYALASAILLWLTQAPVHELPKVGANDKFEHATAWFVLTMTGYILAPNLRRAIPAYALAFGALVELLQWLLPFGRDPEWGDLGADTTGVALAVAVFWAASRLARR